MRTEEEIKKRIECYQSISVDAVEFGEWVLSAPEPKDRRKGERRVAFNTERPDGGWRRSGKDRRCEPDPKPIEEIPPEDYVNCDTLHEKVNELIGAINEMKAK